MFNLLLLFISLNATCSPQFLDCLSPQLSYYINRLRERMTGSLSELLCLKAYLNLIPPSPNPIPLPINHSSSVLLLTIIIT